MKVETTPRRTSAYFVPHRSCFATQASPGSVQTQLQTLDRNDSLEPLLLMLLDLFSIHQDGKWKIMWHSLCRISNLLPALWDPRGCISILNRFFSDLVFLFSPSPSLDEQRNHSVLASSGESVSEEDHCKMGNFAFLPPHLARWDGRNSYGIHKNISYLANWLCC